MIKRALPFLALIAAACQAAPTVTPTAAASSGPAASSANALTAAPTPAATLAAVPAGRILFQRTGGDGVEHYFTIKTDGTDEQAVFDAEGCGCAHWMADGLHVMTLGQTARETWSLATYLYDGTERVIVDNPIETLNLAAWPTTPDGQWIAFAAWDESKPANTGLWVGSPDLTKLRQVLLLQEGMLAIEPFGISPNGSRIVFFAETGPEGGTSHAGDLYVVNADGTDLRKLNPPGPRPGFVDVPTIAMSPDGRSATFGVENRVYVADLESGDVRAISNRGGYVWAVSWSPTGDWITYTRQYGTTSVVSLIHPDGTDDHEISPNDPSDEAFSSTWSPDGKFLLVSRRQAADVESPYELWIMDLEGNYIGQVTREPSHYLFSTWAPNPR